MRTTINIDDELHARATKFFGNLKTSEIVNRAIREMVTREAARRLAELGGSEPSAEEIPRRRINFVAEDLPPYGKPKDSSK